MNLKNISYKFSKYSLKSLVLLVLMGSLASCGYDKSGTQSSDVLGFSSAALKGGVPLSDGEMAVALRVCFAFRTKRTKFSVEMLGNTFDFNYIAKDCQGKEDHKSFSAQLMQQSSTQPLRYQSSFSGPYISEVQTDINGYLSGLCSSVLAGETPLNTREIDNNLYEYRFQSSVSGGDMVSVTIGSKVNPTDSAPTVMQKVTLDVLTNATSSGNYQGMVTEATRYIPCDTTNSGRSKSYKQVFQAP